MRFRHMAKKTSNENWHIEWRSKDRIFRLGFFKMVTAGWPTWCLRIPFNVWERMGWIISRFAWITREIRGNQYRLFCFAFGWRFRVEGRWK